jgi:hypothetical protein
LVSINAFSSFKNFSKKKKQLFSQKIKNKKTGKNKLNDYKKKKIKKNKKKGLFGNKIKKIIKKKKKKFITSMERFSYFLQLKNKKMDTKDFHPTGFYPNLSDNFLFIFSKENQPNKKDRQNKNNLDIDTKKWFRPVSFSSTIFLNIFQKIGKDNSLKEETIPHPGKMTDWFKRWKARKIFENGKNVKGIKKKKIVNLPFSLPPKKKPYYKKNKKNPIKKTKKIKKQKQKKKRKTHKKRKTQKQKKTIPSKKKN